MAEQTIPVADLREPIQSTAGRSPSSVSYRTLRGGMSEGVEVVTLDSGAMQLEVLPTRGMGLWRGLASGHPIGWRSPIASPVHPAFVNLASEGGLGWLTGFNELLCRCGLAWNGPPGADSQGNPVENPLTLHGRIANLPAEDVAVLVDDSDGTVGVRGAVREARVFGANFTLETEYRLPAGEATCEVLDRVTNHAAKPAEMQLLYHINVGRPYLEEGSTLAASATDVAPRDPRAAEGIGDWSRCGPPEVGFAEQAYFFQMQPMNDSEATLAIVNAERNLAFRVDFDTTTLPCGTIWKNTAAEAEGYVCGLEPGTGFPNHRSFEREQHRLRVLEPGESLETKLRLSVVQDSRAISELLERTDPHQMSTHRSAGSPFSAE